MVSTFGKSYGIFFCCICTGFANAISSIRTSGVAFRLILAGLFIFCGIGGLIKSYKVTKKN